MPKYSQTHTTAGSIYAIGAEDSPYIKIGSTKTSVKQRLRSLQTGHPAPLHIVASQIVETDLHRIERQIHAFLAAERHHGEWFALKLDTEELTTLIQRAVTYLSAQDRHAQRMLHEHAGPSREIMAPTALRDRCDKAGITLTELATLAHMHLSALSKVEHGHQQLTLRDGIRIAQILGCTTHDLLTPLDTDSPPLASPSQTKTPRSPTPPPGTTQLSLGW